MLGLGLAGVFASAPAGASRLLERPSRYDVAGELAERVRHTADETLKSTAKLALSLTASGSGPDLRFGLFDAACAAPPLCLESLPSAAASEGWPAGEWDASSELADAVGIVKSEPRRFRVFGYDAAAVQLLANPPPQNGFRLFEPAAHLTEFARARWYDARNASWLSEDPLLDVDSPNLYAFVGHQPNMGTDPMGLAVQIQAENKRKQEAIEARFEDCPTWISECRGLQLLAGTYARLRYPATRQEYMDLVDPGQLQPGTVVVGGAQNAAAAGVAQLVRHADELAPAASLQTLNIQKRLAQLASETRDAFLANRQLLRRYLRPREVKAIKREPWRMRLFFGTAVERRMAEVAAKDAELSVLKHTINNAPQDFIGPGGIGYDITGGSTSSIVSHAQREGVDIVITYDSIPESFGSKWVAGLRKGKNGG